MVSFAILCGLPNNFVYVTIQCFLSFAISTLTRNNM